MKKITVEHTILVDGEHCSRDCDYRLADPETVDYDGDFDYSCGIYPLSDIKEEREVKDGKLVSFRYRRCKECLEATGEGK